VFILRAAEYFASHGITQIERVMTDNHFSYRKSNDVRKSIAALGASMSRVVGNLGDDPR